MDWIDATATIRGGMPRWPGDEEVVVERAMDLERGDAYNLSRVAMGLHAGTHVDAPLHFLPNGKGVDEMPLWPALGEARVIAITRVPAITASNLETQAITRGERVLFKTDNSERAWESEPFREDYVYLSTEAAEYLAEREVALVGIDYLSVGPPTEEAAEVHRTLLRAGIWVVEGLVLSGVDPGPYELVCLPLKVARGDGAPARVILRPLPS